MERKNLFSKMGATLILVSLMMVAISTNAFAAGTLAGTAITNQARAYFNAGGDPRSVNSNLMTLYVAHKVVIGFTPENAATTPVDGQTIFQEFTVINNGNRVDAFTLTVPATVATLNRVDQASAWAVEIVELGNQNVVASTGSLEVGASFTGRLKVTIPFEEKDAQIVPITLTATSTATNDVIGVDPAHQFFVANLGWHVDFVWTVTIKKPVITYSVVQTVSNKIPGESQTFTLTVTNTGTLATSGDATVTWKYDNTNLTSATATGGAAVGGMATWTISSLAASIGSTALTFTATIEQTTHDGTGPLFNATITNGGTGSKVVYGDGVVATRERNVESATDFNVGKASGASWDLTAANQSANPTGVVEYHFRMKNTGNHSDTYDLSTALKVGDVGNFNLTDVVDIISLASNGVGTGQIVALAAGGLQDIYIKHTIPASATDGQMIKRNIIVATTTSDAIAPTSSATSAVYDAPLITTVTAPSIAVTLSNDIVVPAGGTKNNPAPGDQIIWTVKIENTGTGAATSVSLSNMTAHTSGNYNTFVDGSIEVDPTNAGSFTAVNSGGTFTGGTWSVADGIVSVVFSSIAGKSGETIPTALYRYKVLIPN